MGWGHYAPSIIYGFQEKENDDEIICESFLEKYNLEVYPAWTNKDRCLDIIYGITLRSFEEVNIFDKSIVDEAFKIASKKREYNSPTFLLCLIGFEIDHFIEYDPENL